MKVKKIFSLLTALMLLVSATALSVSAEPVATLSIQTATEDKVRAKSGEEVQFDVVLEGAIGYVEMKIAYPSDLFTYVEDSFTTTVADFYVDSFEAGSFAIKYKELTNVENTTVGSFKLKACSDADLESAVSDTAALKGSFLEADLGVEVQKLVYDKDGGVIEVAIEGTEIKVVPTHTNPSIEDVTLTTETEAAPGVEGIKITAETVNWSDNWNLANKTEFKWTVDGKDPVYADTFIPDKADLGKTLTLTATPKVEDVDVTDETVTGTPVVKTMKIVPPAGYKTEATVTLEKVTIGKKVELGYESTKYAVATDAPTYKWYVMSAADAEKVLDAKDIAAAENATAMEGEDFTIANPTFEKTIGEGESEIELKGMWAVVEVTAYEKIGADTYPAEPNVYYAAAEIKSGNTTAVQGGASLVTGTTNTPSTPADPEKPVDPEEPGTEEPGTEEPGVSEDPAGTANEAGAAAFTDVDKEAYAWAYDSIDVLAKAGVIKGMTADTFGPELTTTNAQVIALVARIAGLTAEEGATTDKVDAEHWVAGEMAIADANGILTVFGDGAIDVEGETTREIAFTLLYNALKAAGVELPETAEAIEFTDAASIDEGCVEAIDALVKAGIINGMGDGTLAPKATITRAQLAKILGLADALIAE